MQKPFFNAEGYPDPTAYQAMNDTGQFSFRPVVYICSRYSDDPAHNTTLARNYCRRAVDLGYLPIAPHLYLPQFLSEDDERELALFMDYILMTKCVEFWVCGTESRDDWSDGMRLEVRRAKKRRMRIRYFDAKMQEIASY
jgi:dienelactone hydrolase